MNRAPSLAHPRSVSNPPAADLYIFHLQGCVSCETLLAGDDFLGNWEEDGFTFLFFSRPSREKVSSLVKSRPQLTLLDEYHMTYEQWLGEKFSADRIGRFQIIPPWEFRKTETSGTEILLDPGLVFGTGTHPTTRDCLAALEWVAQHEQARSVLDLGTGTGLLALAAARLGSEKILAVDKNGLAAKTAARNVRLNGLSRRVLVIQGSAEDFMDISTDLVIANIHYEVMDQVVGSMGFYNKKWYILSGLLRSQTAKLLAHLSESPVRMQKSWSQDGIWHTYCFRLSD